MGTGGAGVDGQGEGGRGASLLPWLWQELMPTGVPGAAEVSKDPPCLDQHPGCSSQTLYLRSGGPLAVVAPSDVLH